MKRVILKIIAKVAYVTAKIAANSTATCYFYQPKEPECVKKLKRK